MKLSIVLTVYNKEGYLPKAFNALLAQNIGSGEDFEIIAVDDGSTDCSAKVIEQYAKKSERIRILSQANQGLSMARNNGINAAKGEYVWCVDADDIITHNAVYLICEAIKSNADVLPIYARTDGIDKVRNAINPKARTGKEVIMGRKWQHCGVFYIYKKLFLIKNNLRFMPGIYHEDSEFTPRMLYLAHTVKVIPEVLYTVYRDPSSITQVPRVKRAFDYIMVAESLALFFCNNNDIEKRIVRVMNYEISVIINNAFHIACMNNREDKKNVGESFFEKRHILLRPLMNAPKLKYQLEAILFRMFPRHCVKVYQILKVFG